MADGGYDAGDMGGGSFGGGGFTESTTQSWFSRIGNAIKGVLVGLVLFVVSFPLLFWNEGRAVQAYMGLAEGKNSVVSVPADAWIFYRPILGIGLLVAAGMLVGLLFHFRRSRPSPIATAPTRAG
jgi:hypothetical protein